MLLEFDDLKQHLRQDSSHDDENIHELLASASAVVVTALEIEDTTYTPDTAPPLVKALCKEVARSLYENSDVDPMTPAAKRILFLIRDPALA